MHLPPREENASIFYRSVFWPAFHWRTQPAPPRKMTAHIDPKLALPYLTCGKCDFCQKVLKILSNLSRKGHVGVMSRHFSLNTMHVWRLSERGLLKQIASEHKIWRFESVHVYYHTYIHSHTNINKSSRKHVAQVMPRRERPTGSGQGRVARPPPYHTPQSNPPRDTRACALHGCWMVIRNVNKKWPM